MPFRNLRKRLSAPVAMLVSALLLGLPAAAQVDGEVPLPRPNPERLPVETPAPGNDLAGDVIRNLFDFLGGGADNPAEAAAELLPQPDLLFRSAYRRLLERDVENATRIARSMPNPTGAKVIDWLIATDGTTGASTDRIREAIANLQGWPGQVLMRIRLEQALMRENPAAERVIEVIGGRVPELEAAALLLMRAYVGSGRSADAETFVRQYWRERTFSEATEQAILAEFGSLLSADDHLWRMRRLLYDASDAAALRTAALLDRDQQAIAAAWAAVNQRAGNASNLLNAVAQGARSDVGYLYARLRQMVRTGSLTEAAALLRDAPTDPEALVDPDAWSVQRRSIGWTLAERGNGELAYEVLDGHSAAGRLETAEISFLAGWVALRLLDQPDLAIPHFELIAASSSLPLSLSRAAYWVGRSHDEAGRTAEAEASYRTAAEYPTTFYGQLALARLGETTLPLAAVPDLGEAARDAFRSNEVVTAMGWLDSLDRPNDVDLIARYLADNLETPADIILLGQIFEARGQHQLVLQLGKLAANRDLAVDMVAFPTAAIPTGTTSNQTEMALIYAIARQESSFNTNAVSAAGAMGLLQLLPSTARDAARSLGITFTESRLTSDPAYNAILGGWYIRWLRDRYDGDIILMLCAYNAGLSRADEWVAEYGHPYDAGMDPIDWIERIPFAETRNYVQRVIENLQVYRALLGDPELLIARDLGIDD